MTVKIEKLNRVTSALSSYATPANLCSCLNFTNVS